MRSLYLSLILCFFSFTYGFSQSISVSSFKLLESDLTANTAGTTEIDQNGEVAALIKVVTTQTGFLFDGGALGVVKAKQTPGEIWVYIPHGAKKITIKHPQLGVLRDYPIPCAIESGRTYEMILVTGEVKTIIKQARSSQYVVFQLEPANSVVELNGELLETVSGTATKLLEFGTYDYRIKAPNHDQEVGKITICDPHNKHIVNVRLKSNLINVTIKADNDAEIWVNGEKKGVGIWTGGLGAGFYEMEAKKAGHRSTLTTKKIAPSDTPHIIQLESPSPIYGEAEIESKPAMAEIYIDGKKVGQTPLLLDNILVGDHTVVIRKDGFADHSSSVTVKENEKTKHLALLNQKEVGDVIQRLIDNMVYVEGGTFTMGATIEQEQDASSDEKPVHKVSLSSFSIGKYEVTQEEWQAVMEANPSNFKGPKLPVESVSWNDCQIFIRRLNEMTGKKFRFPTEAEWEYAARGGNKSLGYKYAGNDDLDKVAWYDENSGNCTHEVGQKMPNELGIYDMSGNVWEWCQDKYEKYSNFSQSNPQGLSSRPEYVRRGGSWFYYMLGCRVSYRNYDLPEYTSKHLGLRLALTPTKESVPKRQIEQIGKDEQPPSNQINEDKPNQKIYFLGSYFSRINDSQRKQLGIKYGIQLSDIGNGPFEKSGVPMDFIIQKINSFDINESTSFATIMMDILDSKKKNIVIQGVLPTGKKGYFYVSLTNE